VDYIPCDINNVIHNEKNYLHRLNLKCKTLTTFVSIYKCPFVHDLKMILLVYDTQIIDCKSAKYLANTASIVVPGFVVDAAGLLFIFKLNFDFNNNRQLARKLKCKTHYPLLAKRF
jgi:hypothetical protein